MGDVMTVRALNQSQPWEVQFQRDALGLELERLLPGGVKARWKRDRLGRPVGHEVTAGPRTDLSRQYEWDVNDRLKKIIDLAKGTTTFEHDTVGNLSGARYYDGTEELRMPDAVGNLFRTRDRKDRKYGPAGQPLGSR